MSAWADLVNRDGSDEWLALCSRALEEIQRETSRRNAEKIRQQRPAHHDHIACVPCFVYGEAARVIDVLEEQ